MKNEPGVAISPTANTAVAMTHTQRQSSGDSMRSPRFGGIRHRLEPGI